MRLALDPGVQLPQPLELHRVRPVPVRPRRLEDRRQLLERGMREERVQPLAHQPGADRVVAVAVRAERLLRVVDVQAAQPVEADLAVEVGDGGVEHGLVGDVDARRVPVAGVEADAEPRMVVERGMDRGELVGRASDRAARAGRVLHQQPQVVGRQLEQPAQRGHDLLETHVEALRRGASRRGR